MNATFMEEPGTPLIQAKAGLNQGHAGGEAIEAEGNLVEGLDVLGGA